MSVRVMSWVWENSASTGADRLVLLAIADAANDAGTDAYPGMATIARKANVDKRTAQRSVKALAALGEIVVSENAGPHGTHRYRITMTKGRQDATRGDPPPVVNDHPGDTSPRQDATVTSDPTGGGISSHKGRQDATRTVLEPSTTRPEIPTRAQAFAEFWSIYPRRIGKRGAESEFERALKRAELPTILAGAARYRDDPNREDAFTKHPSTWLHQDCWDDDPLPPRATARAAPGIRRRDTDDKVRDGLALAQRLAESQQPNNVRQIGASP